MDSYATAIAILSLSTALAVVSWKLAATGYHTARAHRRESDRLQGFVIAIMKAAMAYTKDAQVMAALREIQEQEAQGVSRSDAFRQYAAGDEPPDNE